MKLEIDGDAIVLKGRRLDLDDIIGPIAAGDDLPAVAHEFGLDYADVLRCVQVVLTASRSGGLLRPSVLRAAMRIVAREAR